ncbi:MAG: hypothetical protein KF745_04175 [Phycisphaeraceae bacterium]|nr:hypothetical protein [Phycisphaeraceae bacterium]
MRWSVVVVSAAAGAASGQSLTDPDCRDDVFYHFMPIAWRDSDGDAQRFGDFGGMTASLDYLQSLGVTAVWINPIFPTNAYHGYQHGAADQVNPRFGTEAQFVNFVGQAHARGIKVFVDFVAYGISHTSTWYQSARSNPSSPYDLWLGFTNGSNTQYTGSIYSTWNGQSVGFIHWNLANPGPVGLVTGWARHWLDPNSDGNPSDGIDGYRLDHAYAQSPDGPNGWGANIEFWEQWTGSLKQLKPTVFNFAEQGDWGNYGTDLLPAMDAAFTKPFEFAARDAVNSETAAGLYSSMRATLAAIPAGRTSLAIVNDHDVNRLTSEIGGSMNKAKAAAAVLLLQPLTPIIYYGDEIGMLGTKQSYGSDADDIPMREPFKWNRLAGPPMSNYWVLNSGAYNGRFSQDNDGRSVEEQSGISGSLLETYRTLIAARRANIALRRGEYTPIVSTSSRVWAFHKSHALQNVIVAINLAGSAQVTSLNMAGFRIAGGSATVTNAITGSVLPPVTSANQGAYSVTVPGYGYVVLAADVLPPAPEQRTDGRNIPADLGASARVAVQTCATGLGDNVSELDALYVRPVAGGVVVGVAGNLAIDGTSIAIMIDTDVGGPAGQDVLNTPLPSPPAGLQQLTGTRLDAGFRPDRMWYINTFGGSIFVDGLVLPAGGAATKTYRGAGLVNSGLGVLSGGSNPNGLKVACDNSNSSGVTRVSVADAAGATTGFEVFISKAELGFAGSPCRDLGIAAMLVRGSGEVSNQWLPGVLFGTGSLGTSPDMTIRPGNQFAVVPIGRPADWDLDGQITPGDLAAFINEWSSGVGSGGLAADFDGDGAVTPSDVAGMVNSWLSALTGGC